MLGLLISAGALAACTPIPPPTTTPRDLDGPARLVVTERWRDHGRLIIVDETGDRLAPLLVPGQTAAGGPATDEHPAFSPDGRWIVFASDRERDGGRSLWLAEARPDAVPVRLTTGASTDVDPTWPIAPGSPDGLGAILFASDRAGEGSFDLFRLALTTGDRMPAAAAEPERLTDAATHELAPSAVGARLVLQVVDAAGGRSWIAERLADGALVALTDGPADGSPALAPDGQVVAHVSARVHPGGNRDLDVIVRDGLGAERPGLALDGSDEGAPMWSIDGRWLFATSIIRDDEGAPLLPSVIHRDTWGRPGRVRMLRDRAGAAPRLGAAVAPVVLDQTELARNLDRDRAVAYALAELAERAAAVKPKQPPSDQPPASGASGQP